MGPRKAGAPTAEPARKSQRTVNTEGPKSWDTKQRNRIRDARLAMLERDNHQSDNTHMMKVQALSDDVMVGTADTKRKKKKATLEEKTKNRTLDQIMQDGKADLLASYGVSHHDVVSRPPALEGRKLCSVCGHSAPYCCRITGMPFEPVPMPEWLGSRTTKKHSG